MSRSGTWRLSTALLWIALAVPAAGQDLDQRYRAGVGAFQQGRVHEALNLLGAVAAADPDYRDVQLLLGQACLAAGLQRAAKQHFERALEADPANGHAAFLLGLALYQASRHYEAAEALARAHLLAPQNPHPLIYRARSLLELGRVGEARVDVDAALALAPDEPTARSAAAELELAQGRLDRAEERLLALLREDPGSFELRLLLSRVLFAARRPAAAVPILRQLAAAPTPRSDVLYLLAQTLLRSGETEAGRTVLARFKEQKTIEDRLRVLEAAVSTDPRDAEARIEFARRLLDQNLDRHAALHVAALRDLAPTDPRVASLTAELERRTRARP